MREVVIASAVRTGIGRFQGSLSGFSSPELGSFALKEAVLRASLKPEDIEEVIMGNVVTAGLGQNPARQAMIGAGLPVEIGAFTVNKVCGSGLKSVMIATSAIRAEEYDIIAAGGMESMSNAPYILRKARTGYRLGDGKIVDAMVFDGLWDKYNNFHMGITGEIVAERFDLTREEIDEFAVNSHLKAAKATEEGWFKDEVMAVEVPQRKADPISFTADEGIRADSSAEKLGKLKPAFKEGGVVTAGNASQLSDGASAVVVMEEELAGDMNVKPLVRVVEYATAGMEPEHVMSAPIPTVKKLLKKAGLTIDDIDVFEHNEAFASASVAVQKEFDIPDEKFNVHGGAVALGHPIGASGTRVLTTMIYAMKRMDANLGLCTLCLGGGNAVAMVVENIK